MIKRFINTLTLTLTLLLILNSCGHLSSESENKKESDVLKQKIVVATTSPKWDEERDSAKAIAEKGLKRIVIASTNDFHGNLEAKEESFREGKIIKVGGAELLSAYIKILRERYSKELLLVDSGDIYSGTMISDYFKGQSVLKFYNYIGYDALTIGNHEFDYGPLKSDRRVALLSEDAQGALKELIKKSKTPFVNSNIIDISSGKEIKWQGILPYLVKEIDGIQIGIIGITTTETPKSTIRDNIRGLYFNDMASSILKTAHLLRNEGVDATLLLIHEGIDCKNSYKYEDKGEGNIQFKCEEDGALLKVLQKLPPKSVDAVVSGHTHTPIYHFINGIPVIQAYSYGRYLSKMELYFGAKDKKFHPELTKIDPPTKICGNFFAVSNNCDSQPEVVKDLTLKEAMYLGKEVKPDPAVAGILKEYGDQIKAKSEEVVTDLKVPLLHLRDGVSPLSQFAADAIKFVTKSDVAVMNGGGLRTPLLKGVLKYGDLYKTAPFENNLMTVKMSGEKLIKLVEVATSGHRYGMAGLAGLKVKLSRSKVEQRDLNGDGKMDDWENNRVLSVELSDGSSVKPDKIYTVGTQTFLGESGGDNFSYIFRSIPKEDKSVDYNNNYRNALVQYFKNLEEIKVDYNSEKNPYLQFSPSKVTIVE